jgi:hypothetical protein
VFPIAFLEDIKIKEGKKNNPSVEICVYLNTEGKCSSNDSLDKCEGEFDDQGFSSPICLGYAAPNYSSI